MPLLKRKKTPVIKARFAQWAFVDLILLFGAIFFVRPIIALTGLGTVMIMGSILVLANAEDIWKDYKKSYKPGKSDFLNRLNEPRESYYWVNRFVLCPLILFTGLAAIYCAIMIG